MKKVINILVLLLIVSVCAQAQGRKGGMPGMIERMKVEKISFLATQLELTPAEAQIFWPVYNEFDRKRLLLEMNKRELDLKVNNKLDTFSESELKKMNTEFIQTFLDEAHLMQEYNTKFLEVLPVDKVIRLYQAERKFRSKMLQELRQRIPERD